MVSAAFRAEAVSEAQIDFVLTRRWALRGITRTHEQRRTNSSETWLLVYQQGT
jgi:hypothetical protein